MAGRYTLNRQMTIGHSDFFRLFSAIPLSQPCKIDTDRITIGVPDHEIQIRLAPEIKQHIGSLVLPETIVELSFIGHNQDEIEAFLALMDLYFRRGGG